jgi:hypothetical protein
MRSTRWVIACAVGVPRFANGSGLSDDRVGALDVTFRISELSLAKMMTDFEINSLCAGL